MSNTIRLPYNFTPRTYQLPILKALDSGYKRVVVVGHRRMGKDKVALNYLAKRMFQRVGTYYYFFPTYTQGKKILWDGIDRDGFKFMDHIPTDLRVKTNDQEMKIELINGSMFQVVGSDRIDSIVGTNPIGCVYSEYALQDPTAWDYIRPIVAENDGWVLFCSTPRGKNHFWDIYQLAEKSDDWWSVKLTVEDTGAIPQDILDQERKEIMELHGDDALFMQEFFCSFEVPIQGAYYASQILKAEKEKRIALVPHESTVKVHTAWDLGIGDEMAIWFFQTVGKEIRFIDYYESSGEALRHYIQVMNKKDYIYGIHYAPFDIEVREIGTGKSRKEVAKNLGVDFKVVPKLPVDEGIDAARNIFNRCWFDKDKCSKGLNALRNYRKEYDEKRRTYRVRPVHDYASHGCFPCGTSVLLTSGRKNIEDVEVGEEVVTPFGRRKVMDSGVSGVSDGLYTIEMSDGTTIKATGNHKFYANGKFVRADALRYNDVVEKVTSARLVWWKIILCSLRLTKGSIGFRAAITEQKTGGLVPHLFIGLFGSITRGKFQRSIACIIRMVMDVITILITWSWWKSRNIYHYMRGLIGRVQNIGRSKLEILIVSESLRLNGTSLVRGGSGIVYMGNAHGKTGKLAQRHANFAGKSMKRTILKDRNFAVTTARVGIGKEKEKTMIQGSVSFVGRILRYTSTVLQGHVLKVVRVDYVPGLREVYNLTIEKDNVYYANNVLVSNSDAFRYFAVGFKERDFKERKKREKRGYGTRKILNPLTGY